MNPKIVRYGVIGVGRGLDIVMEGLSDERGKVVVCCDKNEKTLRRAEQKLAEKGVTDCLFCSDFEELLKADIDAVIIATDAVCHVPFVVKAMEAGKHVLCEIPSVNTLRRQPCSRKRSRRTPI